MRRTDSESAFQEFLKKIPSSNNLGSMEANTRVAASMGMPRVSSFDLLRNLAQPQPQPQPSSGGLVKAEGAGGEHEFHSCVPCSLHAVQD
jgi:hypothetical protein